MLTQEITDVQLNALLAVAQDIQIAFSLSFSFAHQL